MEWTEVKLETTVEDALLQSRFELLHDEIAKDPLTKWITDFDKLSRENKRGSDLNEFNDFPPDVHPISYIIAPIIQNALTPKISFYFASLFHIGRQWQVAHLAGENAEQALLDANLEKTVNMNLEAFHNDFDSLDIPVYERPLVFYEAVREILTASQEQHSQKVKKSMQLWDVWKTEVKELKDIVQQTAEKVNELDPYSRHSTYYNQGFVSILKLIFFPVEQNRLYHLLLEDNVQFKDINNSVQMQNLLSQLLPLVLLSGNPDPMREFEHTIRYYADLLRRQQLAPVVQKVQMDLLQLFENKNPFEKYEVLKSPPDSALIKLWENCKLPNGEMFYYAEQWKNSLEVLGYYLHQTLPFKSIFSEDDVESYTRSADSTIKDGWVSELRKTPLSDTDFIQTLFEDWIKTLAYDALYPTRENKGSQLWDINSFFHLMNKVTKKLNSFGYKLETPSMDRFNNLWKEAAKKDNYNSYYINW